MKVSCIMPTAGRTGFVKRAVENFLAQDWEDKELIIICEKADKATLKKTLPAADNIWEIAMVDKETIGAKRNLGASFSTAEIIVHMDDDDLYAPDWISRSVQALTSSGGNLTGLSTAYYKDVLNDALYLYTYPRTAQPYVLEATMCYYRKYWEQRPFKEISEGEGIDFCAGAIVRPHMYVNGFTATLHGANTASHKQLCMKEFKLVKG
jgi:glycosyltransferase involved in cell wall biosynthesis